jgi:hypothetical protein
MSKPIEVSRKVPHLRVIEGGKDSGSVAPVTYRMSSRVTPAEVEENKLRVAIMQLLVPELGVSVDQALQEMSDKLDTGEDADFARLAVVRDRLESMGLRFALARPEMDLTREGYLVLAWPNRLERIAPQLADLHPIAHNGMALG